MAARAAITGLGVITSLGRGLESHARCLEQGKRRMARPTLFEADEGGPVAEVENGLLPTFGGEHAALASRANRMVLAALDEAVAMAGLGGEDLARAALTCGTTSSGILEGETTLRGVGPDDPRPAYRHFDDQYVAGACGRAMAAMRGIGGPRLTVSTACSSSANALTLAAASIEQGLSDVAIVVGVDTLTRMTYHGFGSLGLVSPVPCAPFDRGRQGLTLGEGAACIVLEATDRARERGAALACVLGWARNVDGHHITQPDPEGRGIESCVRAALAHAGLEPGDVDHINAHGTGTPQNDMVEGTVIGRVFGDGVPVTSTKSYTGHTLGAAGALEVLFSVLSMREGFVPPSLGVVELDPRIPVDVVRGEPLRRSLGRVVSSSFGFGGNNCCVVIGDREAV
jgi:3-oxoacyl-(acyl-carrier-protein) synthase